MQNNSTVKITQIQGLRALAAILVTLFHAKWVSGGFIGVDIFYVISGFLITGLLLREIDRSGTINFKEFYSRRFKRLLPTSFFVLAITAVVSWMLIPATMRTSLGRDVIAASLYVSNYLFAWWQADYQNLDATPSPVIHYWSLAVEEQFYLVWPLLILLFFTLSKYLKNRMVLTYLVATITLASFIFSIYQTENSPIWAFYSLPTRAWELGLGALLVLVPPFKTRKFIGLIGFVLLIISAFLFNESTPFPGLNAALPVIGTVLLIATINSWPPFLNDVANSRFSQWLGEISYPLYLWHWPLLVIPAVYLGRGLHIYEKLICVLATLIFADLTHRFIEEPLRHAQLPARTVIRGGVIATAISLSMGLAINSSHSDVVTLADGSKYSLAEIMKKPVVYDDGCHVNNGETSSPDCSYGLRGAKRKIVLFGDSHAAQWFPTLEKLANEKGFELISLTKSACPGPAVTKVDTGEYKNKDCFAWREYAFNRIKKINPDAVLVSGFQHFEVPSQYSSRESWWREGEVKTYKSLQGSSQHIIYISDTPPPNRDIPSCIAAGNLDRCNGSERSTPIYTSGYQQINPTPWLCTRTCPGVIGSTVVYRDASHLSVAMALSLSVELEKALTRLGVFSTS